MANSSSARPARIVLLLEHLRFGGTERQALELARGLNRQRFHPEIWTLDAGDDLAPLARSWGIPVMQLSHCRKPGPATLARLWQLLKSDPPDLLLTLTALPNIWGRLLGRGAGAPLIVGNVRSLTHQRQHEGWLWPLADHILCNSKAIKYILNKDCKISPARVSVIPNGVDTKFFLPETPLTGRKPIILCVGRLVPEKDHETLIRAFSLVSADYPAAQLWLVGNGPLKADIAATIKQIIPPGRVRFLPARPDLRPLLEQASMLVLSSRQEAFPNVILEAMAMGLPVVATRVGGVPELVIPGETGWLAPPGNVPALAAALAQLLGDPETCKAFGKAARQRAQQDFSLAAMVRRHEEVFDRLLKRQAAAKAASQDKKPVPIAVEAGGPRVAYSILWFPEPSQTFVLDEVNTLRLQGLDVEVFTLYGPRPPGWVAGMAPALAPVHRLGLASFGTLFLDLLRLIRDRHPQARLILAETLVRKWRNLETAGEALWATLAGVHLGKRLPAAAFDHIHAPWADGPTTAAWVASRLSGIPFSFGAHAHDIYPPDGALVEKLKAASFINTASAVNRNYFVALEPSAADKITVIHAGVPLTSPPGTRRTPRPPYQLLGLGRFVAKKGFTVLLAACRELAAQGLDFHLTLAGDGPQHRELEELAHNYGLGARVSFPGFVPHHQVPALLQGADLFIMPCIV
ncbi:MAG: glycosyltransferase, partial [Syntrophales bacterium]|nr:glycosyltransferase [Syntrophales bacterium]